MADGDKYWSIVEPIWEVINIYDGPDVFLHTLTLVRSEAALLYSAHFCQSEVCNGGFDQFFSNSTGVLAPEAVEGFAAIGQRKVTDIIAQAMSILGFPYPRKRESRQAALELLAPDSFDNLDERFFALIESENGGFKVAADNWAGHIRNEPL